MTKKLLKQSLIELMKDKSIHTIKIKEICEKADINRSTFYKHYNSPYGLYDEIFEDVGNKISALLKNRDQNSGSYSDLIESALKYAESEREMFLVILSGNGCMSVGEMLSNIVDKFIDKSQASPLSRYCIQFVSAGITNILWIWLNEEKRRSAHEVAVVISALINHGLKRAVAFAGN